MIAVPLVTAVYFMMNVAYMTVLTIPEMIAAPAVAVVITTIYSNLILYTQKTVVSPKFTKDYISYGLLLSVAPPLRNQNFCSCFLTLACDVVTFLP